MIAANHGTVRHAIAMPIPKQISATKTAPNRIVAPVAERSAGDRFSCGNCPLAANPSKDTVPTSAMKSRSGIIDSLGTMDRSALVLLVFS